MSAVQAPRRSSSDPSRSTARNGDVVALGDDRVTDQLEIEHADVAGVEHDTQDALDWDVTVAGYQTLRGSDRADLEVAHLHEPDAVDARSYRLAERTFGPARIEFHAHADVEPVRQVDGVLQCVDEADIDPQRVGVFDRERDTTCRGGRQDGRERGVEIVGRGFPAQRRERPRGEHHAFGANRGGGLDRVDEPVLLFRPALRVGEVERAEADEIRDP